MKHTLISFAGALALTASSAVWAAEIRIEPPLSTIQVGDLLALDVVISDLGDLAAPAVSIYDLSLSYDETNFAFNSVLFGDPVIGNQLDVFGFGTDQIVDSSVPGVVGVFELSFDSAADLVDNQVAEFGLFQLVLSATSPVMSSVIDVTVLDLGDENGAFLASTMEGASVTVLAPTNVPLQSTWWLVGIGCLLAGAQRSRSTVVPAA